MVPELAKFPYEIRLKKMKLSSLVFKRISGDAIETFKYMQHKYSIDSNHLLPRWRSTVNTRGHELRLQKRYCNSELRANFFGYRTVNPWNCSPNRVVTSSSLGCFKGRLINVLETAVTWQNIKTSYQVCQVVTKNDQERCSIGPQVFNLQQLRMMMMMISFSVFPDSDTAYP